MNDEEDRLKKIENPGGGLFESKKSFDDRLADQERKAGYESGYASSTSERLDALESQKSGEGFGSEFKGKSWNTVGGGSSAPQIPTPAFTSKTGNAGKKVADALAAPVEGMMGDPALQRADKAWRQVLFNFWRPLSCFVVTYFIGYERAMDFGGLIFLGILLACACFLGDPVRRVPLPLAAVLFGSVTLRAVFQNPGSFLLGSVGFALFLVTAAYYAGRRFGGLAPWSALEARWKPLVWKVVAGVLVLQVGLGVFDRLYHTATTWGYSNSDLARLGPMLPGSGSYNGAGLSGKLPEALKRWAQYSPPALEVYRAFQTSPPKTVRYRDAAGRISDSVNDTANRDNLYSKNVLVSIWPSLILIENEASEAVTSRRAQAEKEEKGMNAAAFKKNRDELVERLANFCQRKELPSAISMLAPISQYGVGRQNRDVEFQLQMLQDRLQDNQDPIFRDPDHRLLAQRLLNEKKVQYTGSGPGQYVILYPDMIYLITINRRLSYPDPSWPTYRSRDPANEKLIIDGQFPTEEDILVGEQGKK